MKYTHVIMILVCMSSMIYGMESTQREGERVVPLRQRIKIAEIRMLNDQANDTHRNISWSEKDEAKACLQACGKVVFIMGVAYCITDAVCRLVALLIRIGY